ncbi:MAG: GDSL-type esterase/lipase family protein [Opitutaceae bacterium]|jgi:lysophospholipase L1-like esterase
MNATPQSRAEPSFILDATRQLIVSEAIRTFGGKVDLALVGDSISGNWRWQPALARLAADRRVLNCGLGGDSTQHLLWRLEQGLLREIDVSHVSLLIGLNNCWSDPSPADVVTGIRACARKIRIERPHARLLLYAIFPLRGEKARLNPLVRAINADLQAVAAEAGADFRDLGPKFHDASGEIPERYMPDGGHLGPEAYEIWADDLLSWLGTAP